MRSTNQDVIMNGPVTLSPQWNEKYFVEIDSNIGIPTEKQNGLFKKFYQISPTVKRKHRGTRLGPTICKEIVEMYG